MLSFFWYGAPMRRGLAFTLLLWTVTGWASVRVYDVTSLQSGGKIPLLSQKTVTFSPLKAGETILFEDKLPDANWSHPAEFQLVSADGTVLKRITSDLPPEALAKARLLRGPNQPLDGDIAPVFSLNAWGGQYRVANPKRFYAVAINGFAEQRHWNDLSFLYRTLTEVYGYQQDHIFVADSNHRTTKSDLNGDQTSDIGHGSSVSDVRILFEHLKATLTADDQLLVVVNTHGSMTKKGANLVLLDGEISATEFTTWLKELTVKNVIAVYEQCFSGGFVRPSIDLRTVAVSASTEQEFSWASMDLRFNEFLYLFTTALAFQNHEGQAFSADVNGDNFISVQEAYGFAILQERRRESPRFESSPNSGLALKLGIGELNP